MLWKSVCFKFYILIIGGRIKGFNFTKRQTYFEIIKQTIVYHRV